MTRGILAPAEDYMEFTHPMWEEVADANEQFKWKGKVYAPAVWGSAVFAWFYVNNRLFEANGLDTPRQYMERGEWDWDTVKELAIALTQDTDNDGEIDQWGVRTQGPDFVFATGFPVVEATPDGSFKNNLRDPMVAKAMNFYYELGAGGLNVFGGDIADFRDGRVAMTGFPPWGHGNDFKNLWEEGVLDVLPYPRVDNNSKHYRLVNVQTMGIGNGAKNPEGAALQIELMRWAQTEAYRVQYVYEDGVAPPAADTDLLKSPILSDDVKALYKEWSTELPTISEAWKLWFGGWDLDYMRVVQGEPWSKVLEEVYPERQAQLEAYFE
jgi:hypothetical protein